MGKSVGFEYFLKGFIHSDTPIQFPFLKPVFSCIHSNLKPVFLCKAKLLSLGTVINEYTL